MNIGQTDMHEHFACKCSGATKFLIIDYTSKILRNDVIIIESFA